MAIKSFRRKGLERFFVTGNQRGIQGKHTDRLRLILGRLNAAADPRDLGLPCLPRPGLQGARKGTWASAERVDYEDYH